jgi:hypothetical protein
VDPTRKTAARLSDVAIHVKLKISTLWAAVMFCYIYGDIFNLFKPGKREALLAGRTPIGPTTQGMLLGFAIFMSIPSVMVFLTLALKPALSRWSNIALGSLYTVIMLITMPGGWLFYLYLGVIEVVLTGLIVWHAWTWPRRGAT